MLDIGWAELLVLGIVALLVVGPKELPALARTVGRYMGVLRKQANEFRAQFDEALRETEVAEMRREMDSLKSEATKATQEVSRAGRVDVPDWEKPYSAPATSDKQAFSNPAAEWIDPKDRPKPAVAAAAAAASAARSGMVSNPAAAATPPEPAPEAAGSIPADQAARPHGMNGVQLHDTAQHLSSADPIKVEEQANDDDAEPTRREVALP